MDAMMPMRAVAHRVGGTLLLGGALAWLVLAGLHGDLPATGHQELADALRPGWAAIHILTVVSVALTAAGMAMIGGTLADPRAAVFGRLGAPLAIPAGAVLGVGYAIDGFAVSGIAEMGLNDPAMAEMAMMQGTMVLRVIRSLSFAFQVTFGLAVLAVAGATLLSREYPRWLCALGVLGGAMWALAGFLLFVGVERVGEWLAIAGAAPGAVWMLGVGWLAWNRGSLRAATG